MKAAYLTVLICCYNLLAIGQEKSNNERQIFIQQLKAAAAQRNTPSTSLKNNPGPGLGLKIQANVLLNTTTAKSSAVDKPLQKTARNAAISKTKRPIPVSRPAAPPSCQDTSFRLLKGVYNGYLYVQSVTQSLDGGLFVGALMHDSTNLVNLWGKGYGLLIKMNSEGEIVWIKQFEDLTGTIYDVFFMMRIFELPNQDIISFGLLATDANLGDRYQTVVHRLSANGNIIWQSCMKSNIAIFNSPSGTFSFWIESAFDGLNGDVILCGTTNSNYSAGKIQTVVRLNNQGKLVWDANYGNHGVDGSYLFGAEGISAFMQNGQIMLVGLSHGTNNPPMPAAVNFLTLDYNNGNLLDKRFFRPSYPSYLAEAERTFTYWANRFIRLSNGHYLFYGKLGSQLINMSPTIHYFGVIEFDAQFNRVDAYTISAEQASNYASNSIYFDPTGRGLISVFEYIGNYEANVFFGSFSNKQFQNQRKVRYNNAGLPGNNGLSFLKDNGYAFVQTYFDGELSQKSYFEFRKMHNSDTSSICLGSDTALFRFLPLNIIEDPNYWLLDPNEPNRMMELPLNMSVTDTISSSTLDPCRQTNYCDTVKIHGNPVICGNASSILFTTFKNKECGAIVKWTIDGNAVDSLQVLSDSSARIWFKNINWQGKLYASLPAGNCNFPAVDSISVSVTRLQTQLNLGTDTVLCANTNLHLDAGPGFSSYQWQDGTTNPVLTVSMPGQYWVKTSDYCGNDLSDTINILPFNIAVNIGADRIKCNNDTIHLEASPGFINYSWGPAYNIAGTTGQQTIVEPDIDTAYFVKAEKSAGCFAYDTVRIKVNHSPAIDLGTDKSFCNGDSVVLNAGAGFTQYQWSNGTSSPQVTVFSEAGYSVIGSTAEGCHSYDTVQIKVWPNPVITLDDDPDLCRATTRILQPAGNYSSYLWQNGSSSASLVVSDTGIYHLTVWDSQQCKGSDTVHIANLLPLPAGFLPADTAICNYGTLILQATGNYNQYTWNNNLSSSVISVTEPGIYWLDVIDENNCRGRDSVIVNPKDCLNGFYIPTAFTPNSDGINDIFKPFIGGVVKAYQFSIYNRWGQLLFTSKELRRGWDGSFGGTAQDSNVFTWICTYQLEGQATKLEKGTVIIVR